VREAAAESYWEAEVGTKTRGGLVRPTLIKGAIKGVIKED
jgi:hypothetical protein